MDHFRFQISIFVDATTQFDDFHLSLYIAKGTIFQLARSGGLISFSECLGYELAATRSALSLSVTRAV